MNMTTGAPQADMTLIMVCESTRPRVQRALDHGLDQQVADENSVRSQSHREVVQEIAQLSSGQDAKTNDHVGRIQGVVRGLAV